MAPRTEEEIARTLAAQLENCAAQAGVSPVPQAIENGLYDLLYGLGGDGVMELSVAEAVPTRITIVGIVVWVAEQTLSPFEAKFQLGTTGSAVKALTLSAGDRRISRRDGPGHEQSWRELLRIIAARPTSDEDWADILHYDFD